MVKRILYYLLFSLTIYACSFFQSTEDRFEDRTGLEITEPIEIIREGSESHDMDGSSWLVFKTSSSQLSKWIKNKPPWSNAQWHRGVVDHQIGFHCNFGDPDGNLSIVTIGSETSYSGNEKMINILKDTNNFFAYEERCCRDHDDALRFHNGSLLIINPETNMVYLSVWDW